MVESGAPKIEQDLLATDADRAKSNRKLDRTLIAAISIAWALFQLALPRFIILDSITVRAVHLAFAVTLVFLTIPVVKRKRKAQSLITATHIPLVDYVLAAAACLSALYLALDWAGLSMRPGLPIPRDTVLGIILILLLLEARPFPLSPSSSPCTPSSAHICRWSSPSAEYPCGATSAR